MAITDTSESVLAIKFSMDDLKPIEGGQSFVVSGFDMYGNPVTETVHETALSRAMQALLDSQNMASHVPDSWKKKP